MNEMEDVRNGRMQSVRTPPGMRSFPPPRARQRRQSSLPASRHRSNSRLSLPSRRRQSREYNRAASIPYNNPYSLPRTRAPSAREMELNAMRQRVAEMQYGRALDCPYENDEFEAEELYYESLDHYGFPRMTPPTRRY